MTYQPHPLRIQRRRAKGYRLPAGAVYVGRPTKWGNPWTIEEALASGLFKPEYCRWVCVEEYRGWLTCPDQTVVRREELQERLAAILSGLPTLRGKQLACWCPLDRPCHADVLAELANQ